MRSMKLVLTGMIVWFLCASAAVVGDWDPGDPYKMHHPQEPDPEGWDVCVCCQYIADDFLCTGTGPITDLHLWLSFKEDLIGDIDPQWADISIWSDRQGKPGTRLWTWSGQGNVTMRPYGQGPQGWVCPSPPPLIVPQDHQMYFQVNITEIPEPFVQTQETVYWLVIKINLPPVQYVPGWKTSVDSPPGRLWGKPAMWSTDGLNWQPVDTGTVAPELHDMAFVITGGVQPVELEYGDAPEGANAIAYPSTGVTGSFPTCRTIGPAGWIQHNNFGGWFGPAFDFELDGNAGLCAMPPCFPPYDQDECFADGDAGLIIPEPYTIDAAMNVVPCPQGNGTPLGIVCTNAVWGQNIDIHVHNFMPNHPPYVPAFVNVLADWDQNGSWGGASQCPIGTTPEWVLQNFQIPPQYDGPLSALMPVGTSFLIGPNPGYVWFRFSITEQPIITPDWDGSGSFEDGETEDYLLRVDREQPPPDMDFGDAPERPYPTTLAANGARHLIPPVITPPCLGANVDTEPDGQPDPNALGDDNDGNDDEDGVTFSTPLIPGQSASIMVTANGNGFLFAWVDFNGDGSWAQPGDQIFNGINIIGGNNPLNFQVPFSATPNIRTFARFRFVTIAGTLLSYDGQAPDGEVEDYQIQIGNNPDIKWVQPPDLTPNGIDIKVDELRHIADDFECTTYGPITDVHFWGSWKGDIIGEIMSIRLAIYSNNPQGPQGYSEPNELLWHREFYQGQFDRMQIDIPWMDVGEYWWDPYTGELIPSGDTNLERIDIYIDPCDAFIQRGSPQNPVIYWLHIQVTTEGGQFGWKTRRWPDHYMDDAVWDFGSELPREWKELRYPPGHPYHELELNSIDMAFVITGQEQEPPPKPPVEHLKWSQPPIEIEPSSRTPTYCGWDELSIYNQHSPQEPPFWKIVADDYRCLGSMPVSSVHWWGSYERWDAPVAPPRTPDAWKIGFWSNVPAGPTGYPPFSHPGELLWLVEVPADRVHEEWAGVDYFPQRRPDTCFQYYVDLKPDEYFWQNKFVDADRGDIFWVSIVAVYRGPEPVPTHQWGWKTRPWHWMDDAVTFQWQGEIRPGFQVDPAIVTPLEGPICTEPASVDVAFELDTHPDWIKWEQSFTGIRDWPHYEDEKSIAIEEPDGSVKIIRQVADDWLCERPNPVTAAVWWGSYIDFRIQPCQCHPPIMPTPIDHFLLTIWTDVPPNPDDPDSFSHPGRKIWQYRAYEFDEVLVGYDKHSGPGQPGQPMPYEPVYRYSVKIPQTRAFDQNDVEGIYWFSVVAVYKQPPADIVHPWGWTNHMHTFQDDAVAGYLSAEDPPVWVWEPLQDQTGQTEDMSFILFTNACPTCLGDLDGNNWVMVSDMFSLIAALGSAGPPFIIPFGDPLWNPCADMDGNGYIMVSDLFSLIAMLGSAGPPFIIPCP